MSPLATAQSHAITEDLAGSLYEDLVRASQRAAQPIDVDFRALLPAVGATERLTHQLHPYPAKLLRHIPALFSAAPQLSARGDVILDPFCGSGTVLVEAQAAGRQPVGIDTNPLAQLLARVKTTPLASALLRKGLEAVLESTLHVNSAIIDIPTRLGYWYPRSTIVQLQTMRAAVDALGAGPVSDFFAASLSSTAKAVSLADPRVSVPVRLRADQYTPDHWLYEQTRRRLRDLTRADVRKTFTSIVEANIKRVNRLAPTALPGLVLDEDARSLSVSSPHLLRPACVITSPPYLGAQKYIRASSLSLLWLGHGTNGDLRDLISRSIGREHFRVAEYAKPIETGLVPADQLIAECRRTNPLRAHLAATYLNEMNQAIAGIEQVLRPGGALVLVAGANRLCGTLFDTPCFLREIAERAGLRVELSLRDTIRSRGLMTRRNYSASVIAQETVSVLRKAEA